MQNRRVEELQDELATLNDAKDVLAKELMSARDAVAEWRIRCEEEEERATTLQRPTCTDCVSQTDCSGDIVPSQEVPEKKECEVYVRTKFARTV